MANSGRAKSCTACRQVKLACNARITAPDPCSRCHSSGLDCRFDSNLKRIPMRKFSKEIVTELHNRRALHPPSYVEARTSNEPIISQSSPRRSTPAIDQVDENPTTSSARPSGAMEPWLQLQVQEQVPPQQLGSVVLHQQTIICLLEHFERYYVPHALFLRPVQSITRLINQSPLLFWTIMLVASHRFDDDGIYDRLIEPLKSMLSRCLCTVITSIETIHVFLIHCLWPITEMGTLLDQSFHYVNLATATAIQMNCHRPLPENNIARNWKPWVKHPSRRFDIAVGDVTWLACFELSARIGTFLGVPISFSNTQQLKSVRTARTRVETTSPGKCSAIYDVLELLCVGNAQLDEIDSSSTTFSLIQSFAARLDSLQMKYCDNWTCELEVDFQTAKLYLYATFFTKSDTANLGEQAEHAAHAIALLCQGLKAANALVEAMTAISMSPILDNFFLAGTLSFFPKWYFTSLYFATAFLAKVLLTQGAAAGLARSQAVAHIMDSHKIFQSFPQDPDLKRAATHIEILVDIIRSNTSFDDFSLASLIINNRLGASLMFDAIFQCGQYRKRNSISKKSRPVSNEKTVNESSSKAPLKTSEEKAPASSKASPTLQTNQQHQEAEMWSTWDMYVDNFGMDADQWNSLGSMQFEIENPTEDQSRHDQMMHQGADPMIDFGI